MDQFAVKAIESAEDPIAEFNGALDDRVKDRLHVGRGLTDNAEDLGCRSLLI